MHDFDELVLRGTSFSLKALEELSSKIMEELKTSGSTNLVKNLQMIRLQKTILAIGMFSLFDSVLQKRLECKNGFEKVKDLLFKSGELGLHNRFEDFVCAINVLKHGQGRSYDALVAKSGSLPFRIKTPEENLFNEGDVSEISTLIEVDNQFVLNCAQLIEQVSKTIRKSSE